MERFERLLLFSIIIISFIALLLSGVIFTILLLDVDCTHPDDGLLPDHEERSRIYETDSTNIFPYLTAIVVKSNNSYHLKCAGTLISLNWVITTADCLLESFGTVEQVKVRAGSKSWTRNYREHQVITYHISDSYNKSSRNNNFGVISVIEPFTGFCEKIVPIANISYLIRENSKIVVAGWLQQRQTFNAQYFGTLENATFINMIVVSDGVCEEMYALQNVLNPKQNELPCTNRLKRKDDDCFYATGSPVLLNQIFVGFFMWIEDCGQSGKLPVLLKASGIHDWLISLDVQLYEAMDFIDVS